jgi:hypothetical protein
MKKVPRGKAFSEKWLTLLDDFRTAVLEMAA